MNPIVKKIQNAEDIYKVLLELDDSPIVIFISHPLASPILKILKKKDVAFRRVGFKKWEISPPLNNSGELEMIRPKRAIIYIRLTTLLCAIVLLARLIMYFFQTIVQQWISFETNMRNLPVASSLVAGCILFIFPWSRNLIISFIRIYLGIDDE